MPSDREAAEIKKAMAYDLIEILEAQPEQQTYTVDEMKKLIKNYIAANTQKQMEEGLENPSFFRRGEIFGIQTTETTGSV